MFHKKKIEEITPLPLTEKEIKTIKDKLSEKENINLEVKDLNINELIPQVFNDTKVTIYDDHHTLILAYGMSGDKFKTFQKSRGGIFNRDVLAYYRGLEHGKYLLIEGRGGIKTIIRLIDDDELLLFQTLKLIHGIIKDKPFMELRTLQEGEKLTQTTRYIKETNNMHEEILEVEYVVPHNIKAKEEQDPISTSVSLFDE